MRDFFFAHAGGKVFKHVIYGNAHFPDAGFASASCGVNGYDLIIAFHRRKSGPDV